MIYSVTNDANSIGLSTEMTSKLNSRDEAWSNDPFSVKSTTGGVLFTGTSVQTVNTILIILITLLLPAIHKFVRAFLLSRGFITISILSESNTDDAIRILRKTNCSKDSKIFSLAMVVTLAITALLSSAVPYSTKTMIDVKLADDIFLALNRPNHTTFLKEGQQEFIKAKIIPGEVKLESSLDNKFLMNTTVGKVEFSAPSYSYDHQGEIYNSLDLTETLSNNGVKHYSLKFNANISDDIIPDIRSDGWYKPKIGSVEWINPIFSCRGKYGEDTQYLYDALTDTYTGYTHCFDKHQNVVSPLFSMRYVTSREKYEEGVTGLQNEIYLTDEVYFQYIIKCHGSDHNLQQYDSQRYTIDIAFSGNVKVTELTYEDSGVQCITTEIHFEIRGGKVLESLKALKSLEELDSFDPESFDQLEDTNSWSILKELQNIKENIPVQVVWNGSGDKARLEHFIGIDPDNIIGLHSAVRSIEENGAQDGVYLCYRGVWIHPLMIFSILFLLTIKILLIAIPVIRHCDVTTYEAILIVTSFINAKGINLNGNKLPEVNYGIVNPESHESHPAIGTSDSYLALRPGSLQRTTIEEVFKTNSEKLPHSTAEKLSYDTERDQV
ncbi:hypothetical protein HDU92_005229 [Lobulomyces angularis]|nr:hypothetical protein HDU92_005229 [Lobulomyces angularis]